MNWWKPLSFTEARAAKGQGITVPGTQLQGGVPVTLHEGKTYRFSTRNIDGTGLVLEVDHALDFAINLQYNAPNGDRRIVRFNPGEFVYLSQKQQEKTHDNKRRSIETGAGCARSCSR